MKDFKEQCWFLYGLRVRSWYIGFLKYHSEGTEVEVDFDWKKALSPFLIGWYHSHSGHKFLTPSNIDDSTMRGWIKGLNRPLLCGIFCSIQQKCYCYYKSDRSTKRESIIVRRPVKSYVRMPFFIGRVNQDAYAIQV